MFMVSTGLDHRTRLDTSQQFTQRLRRRLGLMTFWALNVLLCQNTKYGYLNFDDDDEKDVYLQLKLSNIVHIHY